MLVGYNQVKFCCRLLRVCALEHIGPTDVNKLSGVLMSFTKRMRDFCNAHCSGMY